MTDRSFAQRVLAILWQTFRAIVACLLVAASSVVFPDDIPWLAAAWIAAYSLLILLGRQRGAMVCLGACAAILIFKRLTPAPGLLALLAVMIATVGIGIFQLHRNKTRLSRRFAVFSAIALWLACVGMAYDWRSATHCRHTVAMLGDRPVVCLGDSMTSLGMFGSYTRDLRKLISPPVVDMGRSGIAAWQVAQHDLPELAGHHPQVVVIELGAHDFLRDRSRAETKKSLETIIDASRNVGAEVLLMEIPRAYMSDPFWGLEREIARQKGVELIPDTPMRMLLLHSPLIPPGSWLGEPYLTDESGIHPNAAGNRLLAEHVARALERLWGKRGKSPIVEPKSDQ